MSVVDARTWLEHLSQDDCWAKLAGTPVGRIGVLVDSAPEIYPVNFIVDGHSIAFRTDEGTKLHVVGRSPTVCFEVDAIDGVDRTGWSVLVKGRAREVTSPEELRRLSEHGLTIWGFGPKQHWVRIEPAEVTGRRIARGAEGPLPSRP